MTKPLHDRASGRVGQGMKDSVELDRIVSHPPNYIARASLGQWSEHRDWRGAELAGSQKRSHPRRLTFADAYLLIDFKCCGGSPRLLEPSRRGQRLGLVGSLPREVEVIAAEMAVRGG